MPPAKTGRVSMGGSKRKWLAIFLVLLSLVVGAGAYGYFQITSEVETNLIDPGDLLDYAEAKRKLSRFADANRRQMRGYIRLVEPEINAFLAQTHRDNTNSIPGIQHTRTAVNLGADFVTVYSWVSKKVAGMPVFVVWQRTYNLDLQTTAPEFRLISMKLGDLAVPQTQWAKVNQEFGAIDELFKDEVNIIKKVRALELRPISEGQGFEARLYNYDPATDPSLLLSRPKTGAAEPNK